MQNNGRSTLVRQQKSVPYTFALFGEALADVFPDRVVLGGAPYNVARHLHGLGQRAQLITRAGKDELRKELLREMASLGMDDSGVQCDPVYPTGQVHVHIGGGGHRFEILPDQAYDHIHPGVTHLVTMSTHPDMAYFGTLAQRGLESRLALDTFLSDARSPRFLDMNLRAPWYDKHTIRRSLLRADILKVNEDELDVLADLFRLLGATPMDHGAYLVQKFNLDCLLVTCGGRGAWTMSRSGEAARADGKRLENKLVDTVGAGDGFAAVCMIGILCGWTPDVMLERANAFAAAICGVRGAVPGTQDFYLQFTEEWQV